MPDTAPAGPPRTLRIDIRTRYGDLKGNLAVPPGGMRLAELAWNAMALDDRLVAMAEKAEAAQGRAVSCSKGCGACCRQAVPVSPAEAWMLADRVASLPPDQRDAVRSRFAAARDRLQEAGFGSRSLSGAGRDEMQRLGIEYFKLGLACPFLEDEACSIHPHRPSACREFLATSDPAHCSDPGSAPVRNVPMAVSLTDALTRLSAAALGGEPASIPLALALDWAAANTEDGRRRFDAAQLMGTLFDMLGKASEQA